MSKANQYPYNYVTGTQAHVLAQKINSGNYNGSLMFGVQWDLVMKFLETKGASQDDLRSDSTSWGNYYDSTFKLNRGKYAWLQRLGEWRDYNVDYLGLVESSIKLAKSDSSKGILFTTGASEQTKKMNIYDLAGNVYEWTLEVYTVPLGTDVMVARGGTADNQGIYYPAAERGNTFASSSYDHKGFRETLF